MLLCYFVNVKTSNFLTVTNDFNKLLNAHNTHSIASIVLNVSNRNKKTLLKKYLNDGLNINVSCALLRLNYQEIKLWCAFVCFLENGNYEGEKIINKGENSLLIFLYKKYVENPKLLEPFIEFVYDVRMWQSQSVYKRVKQVQDSQDWKAHQWLIDYTSKNLYNDSVENNNNNANSNNGSLTVNIVSPKNDVQENRVKIIEAEIKGEGEKQ